MSTRTALRTHGAGPQNGIVLVMALILLILVSLVATVAIRRATSGEQISKGMRTQTVAFEAAETALRYCEDQVIKGTASAPVVAPVPLDGSAPVQWKTRSNWALSAGKAIAIRFTVANSADSTARQLPTEALPRCMAESLRLPNDGQDLEGFLITAVGYSPDYRTTAAGTPETGSEVWLQSTITRPR
ncbi:Tfp pilus assembly protein PilX [Variovorax sp. PBS-H4]|uniref:pilus assembly PilX family protein n=1 Tax=Variovorax sp. PBS-H4 TaxID=434008 RepID=UPI0013172C4C|nr:PilX N-terminal domain-containing pilus assembly protein [Variovorax sp. PBS-H4]VTU33726.1 Tfp pilus assembly protein PilX [Variovorax sp. PBS-H4]